MPSIAKLEANHVFRGAVNTVRTRLRKRDGTADFFRHTAGSASDGAAVTRSHVPAKLSHDLGDSVISTAFSNDDLLYAAGCTDKVAKVWERASGKEVASFQASAAITAVVFVSYRGRTKLVVGTFAGQLHFFDVASQQAEQTHKFGKGDAVHSMAATSSFRNGAVPATPADSLLTTASPDRRPTCLKRPTSSASVTPTAATTLPGSPSSPRSRKRTRARTAGSSSSGDGDGDEVLLVVGGKFSHVVIFLVQYPSADQTLIGRMAAQQEEAAMSTGPELVELGRVKPFGTVNSIAIDRSASLLVTGGEAKVVELWSVPRAASRGEAGGSRPETRFS